MSHFAKVENSIVTEVIVAEQDFIKTQQGTWIQTSYNTKGNVHANGGTPLRGNYASVGSTYDATHDIFHGLQPFPSWTLNTNTWLWEAPTPCPNDGKIYQWDETNKKWVGI
jgi:hypothetical protein